LPRPASAVLGVREHGALIKVLAIPVFLLGAAVVTALASVARHAGWWALTFALGLESLLLAVCVRGVAPVHHE
jgi:hypothetical protein